MFSRRYLILHVFLILFSGLLLYLVCRPDMALFQWLPSGVISEVKPSTTFRLLNNYYGDLVWMIGLSMTTIWLVERKLAGGFSVFALLSLPFFTEILQKFYLLPGVFDWFDIIVYSIVICFFILRFPKYFLIWKN